MEMPWKSTLMYWVGCHFLFCDFPGRSCPIIEIKEFLLFAETENRGQRGLTWLFEPIPNNLLTRQCSWNLCKLYFVNILQAHSYSRIVCKLTLQILSSVVTFTIHVNSLNSWSFSCKCSAKNLSKYCKKWLFAEANSRLLLTFILKSNSVLKVGFQLIW